MGRAEVGSEYTGALPPPKGGGMGGTWGEGGGLKWVALVKGIWVEVSAAFRGEVQMTSNRQPKTFKFGRTLSCNTIFVKKVRSPVLVRSVSGSEIDSLRKAVL